MGYYDLLDLGNVAGGQQNMVADTVYSPVYLYANTGEIRMDQVEGAGYIDVQRWEKRK